MNFCTLFDVHYLARGISLIQSVSRVGGEHQFWVLCMDGATENYLKSLDLPRVHLISFRDLADETLLRLKKERTHVEFCWTCTPILPDYILEKWPDLDHIAYVDADCYFFRDPKVLIQTLGEDSVLIFEHHFPPKYADQIATQGRFNVEVVVFRNDSEGRRCLTWWKERCIEWCFHRVEPGRMGDQKYLDQWPVLFKKVRIAPKSLPALAPWNLGSYRIEVKNGVVIADGVPLLFYHFSKLAILDLDRYWHCLGYWIPKKVREFIYAPYFRELREVYCSLRKLTPGFSEGFSKMTLREKLGDLKHKVRERIAGLVTS